MNGTVAIDMVDLDADEFLEKKHSNLYSMLRNRSRAQMPIDMAAVIQHLIQSNSKECGDLVYISSIGDGISYTENVERHIR